MPKPCYVTRVYAKKQKQKDKSLNSKPVKTDGHGHQPGDSVARVWVQVVEEADEVHPSFLRGGHCFHSNSNGCRTGQVDHSVAHIRVCVCPAALLKLLTDGFNPNVMLLEDLGHIFGLENLLEEVLSNWLSFTQGAFVLLIN